MNVLPHRFAPSSTGVDMVATRTHKTSQDVALRCSKAVRTTCRPRENGIWRREGPATTLVLTDRQRCAENQCWHGMRGNQHSDFEREKIVALPQYYA